LGIIPDISIGTMSKAIGSCGGFVTGSSVLREYLINKCRMLIYTTALPDAVLINAYNNIQNIINNQNLRIKLWNNIKYLEKELLKAGIIIKTQSPIIPINVGSENKALQLSAALREQGIYLPAVRYPSVPKGKARLRCTITATHSQKDISYLVGKLKILI